MCMLAHGTPILVEKATIALNVTLRITVCKQIHDFKTYGEGHTKSHKLTQNRGNQWLHKIEFDPMKIKKINLSNKDKIPKRNHNFY